MMPTVKELHSLILTLTTNFQTAMGTIKDLVTKVKKLEEKVKFNSDEIEFIEVENLYPLQEDVFGTDESEACPGSWKSGETKVGILPRLISVETKLQNIITPAPVADQFPPAAHIWGPRDTSILEPLQGSILEIKNDISYISKRINLIQSTDPKTNLVLYGVPETEKNHGNVH